ncbi:Crp/Fnr family transcriptional regulator [Paenibacillus psychroresistens]|uniref:Crp/Fnr family transcriptional regulator n=1 Tax=Paenibacillus psychroresistens TaxID=1778678 RepID=A0A6B8RT09_9BACL|nr:Crp/Fnr family transcriptional regulator [Paenibacillus psychroresistens]QGQ98715.1 Crp/Fnr family transcriptional regulator [Paenibacillus psychroresistens]
MIDMREELEISGETADFFGEENFARLQSIMYPKQIARGAFLFWEGDLADKLYYLRSGQIHLTKSTAEGKDLILSILQKGDLIGEIDGSEETLHSFSAIAIEAADIGVIHKKDLDILLYRHGDFAIQFIKWMGLTHRTTQSKFRDLLLFGKPGALASTLIRMSNTYGEKLLDGIHLKLKLTNTEMADLIGTTREGVNRILNTLKDEGTISLVKGNIVIHRLEDLRKMCNCPTSPPCPTAICRL